MGLIVYSIRRFLLRINMLILIYPFRYISMMIIILFGLCVSIIMLLHRGVSLILTLICIFTINTIRLLWLEFRWRPIIKVKGLVIIAAIIAIDRYISLYWLIVLVIISTNESSLYYLICVSIFEISNFFIFVSLIHIITLSQQIVVLVVAFIHIAHILV